MIGDIAIFEGDLACKAGKKVSAPGVFENRGGFDDKHEKKLLDDCTSIGRGSLSSTNAAATDGAEG
jgi:hypothetical protein